MPQVLVRDGYVVVKLDYVHDNAKDVALAIPLPEDDIFTLGDVRTIRIQWKKKVVFSSRPLVGPQLVVPKSGHAPQRLNLNL